MIWPKITEQKKKKNTYLTYILSIYYSRLCNIIIVLCIYLFRHMMDRSFKRVVLKTPRPNLAARRAQSKTRFAILCVCVCGGTRCWCIVLTHVVYFIHLYEYYYYLQTVDTNIMRDVELYTARLQWPRWYTLGFFPFKTIKKNKYIYISRKRHNVICSVLNNSAPARTTPRPNRRIDSHIRPVSGQLSHWPRRIGLSCTRRRRRLL